MNLNSKDFINRLKERDPESLSLIIDKYTLSLYKMAKKNGLSDEQSDEVLQSTWTSVLENIERFEGRSHIRTYIFGILINKMRELWRKNKKFNTVENPQDLEPHFDSTGHWLTAPKSPDEIVYNDQVGDILKLVIDKLPENQRLAFVMKEIEGIETEEICKILDISRTNLGVLIYRAKNTLRLSIETRLGEDR